MEKTNIVKTENIMNKKNPYLPSIATVSKIVKETPNIISIQVILDNENERKSFSFEPGQVGQISVFGFGESTFVINSPSFDTSYLQFTVMKVGVNTTAISNLSEGEKVGIRAPLGNWFPYKEWENKNVLIVGGGIGLAPLRPLILHIMKNKDKYKNLTVLYGAKTPDDLCYKYDLQEWKKSKDVKIVQTIDNACHGWNEEVGLCPNVLESMNPSPENTIAVTCGPPIMIKYVLDVLKRLNFKPDGVYTTLERRMKCGVGKCGRCNIGEKFVCVDGPVFSLRELNELAEPYI
ncbi:MAG: FAD/NAD(P)-binding protein [Actinomycetota bacterium]|nr:FAD/NAD(P)-binding protein [Actinomycetota bacterium]